MREILKRLRIQFFPPISKKAAIDIVRQVINQHSKIYQISSHRMGNINVYNPPQKPCWYIFCSWGDDKDGVILRSSRLILVSKITGEILYDGSANDEG